MRQKKATVGKVNLLTQSLKKGTVARVRATASNSFVVDAGADQTVEPFSTVTLLALGSQNVSTWTWAQDPADPIQVVLESPVADNGVLRRFLSPGTVGGTALHFILTGHNPGYADASDTVTFMVNAHGGLWEKQSGNWVARGTV
jgi:hypothetical protein